MADEETEKPSTKFKPGSSGNPGGWRRADIDAARRLGIQIRGDVEGADGRNKLADRLLKIALGDDDSLAMKACDMLLDRGYGKAKQSLDLRINDETTEAEVEWDVRPLEERRKLLELAVQLGVLDDGNATEH
jgi:hypothetical protein